jgi:hypothetical protein
LRCRNILHFMISIVDLACAVSVDSSFWCHSLKAHNYTAFRRFTPHHRTGARLVAQSKVNRLMNQRMTSTGTGARRTSVRLRKGSACIFVSRELHMVLMSF